MQGDSANMGITRKEAWKSVCCSQGAAWRMEEEEWVTGDKWSWKGRLWGATWNPGLRQPDDSLAIWSSAGRSNMTL